MNHATMRDPYIMCLHSGCSAHYNFIITVESEVFITMDNFKSALLYLLGVYSTFNMAYPQPGAYPVYIFIQRYVMGIEDQQAVPKCVCQCVSVIKCL